MLMNALALSIFVASALTWTDPLPFRGAVLLPEFNNELPVIAALGPRQGETCIAATETLCADGNGCCPSGAACGYTTTAGQTYGVCEADCGIGAVTCTTPVTACCSAGRTCGADGVCSDGYAATSAILTAAPTFTSASPTAFDGSSYSAGISFSDYASASSSSPLASTSALTDDSSDSVYTSSSDDFSASLSSLSASLSSALASVSMSASSAVNAASGSAASAASSAPSAESVGGATSAGSNSRIQSIQRVLAVMGTVISWMLANSC